MKQDVDIAVIGAGFGGLAAALTAARAGARVAVFEALKYPGGCASTFTRGGVQYEAGATLFSGLGEGQLFDRWRRALDIDVRFDMLDTPIEFRTPHVTLPVSSSRAETIARLCALPDAPAERLRAFFAEQRRVADALWPVFEDPGRLPPFSWSAVGWHLRRSPAYLPLLRVVGRPLVHALRRHRLEGWGPLVSYLNAICQITVQAGVDEAEAPFAMSTMDYCFRGTGHIHGGIGQLAWGLWDAIGRLGADTHLSSRVRAIRRDGDCWLISARKQTVRAPIVIANLLPQAIAPMLHGVPASTRLKALSAQVASGWGAAMLYLTLRPHTLPHAAPHHLELVADPMAPFLEGNHIFCSISGAAETERAPDGLRTATISTHVPMDTLRSMTEPEQKTYITAIQQRMRQTLRQLAPAVDASVAQEMTASPRTFERFTRRPQGLVGGIPRRAGWRNYQGLVPRPVHPGLFLVGDSVFPGQSTLATALGGIRTVRAALSGQRLLTDWRADQAPLRLMQSTAQASK
ncbi:MAG: FAD-dependent oxidoreductase [Myxococcota bacterium]